ncbi:hypothetical protein [Bradyrhizobium prioriisuperbiae]|uniref:hypothetical protein n=1 Tax=Bradyrhizobium prioriisuperbiae TaxID=2854389 RepID=UPI0028EAD041|nr:hypothetical protein [Bradyrhizobium prioritasuperba]
MMSRLSIVAGTIAAIGACSTAAVASQGPGTMPGTASDFTQIAMAVVVYGSCAAVVAAGLLGPLWKH